MDLKAQLAASFGFDGFKKGQKQTIERVLRGESVAAIFPTGSGKSLCYQLPALHLPGLTLVVSPLLSLMKDQLEFLQKHNIAAARLDSSLGHAEFNEVIQQAKSNQLKILMVSVERFKNERFRSFLKQLKVSLLVIDEAHCISEWGHNFRPDYLKLPQYQQQFGIPQVLLLTATATAPVIADMQSKFAIADDNVVVTGFYRNNLFLQMSPTDETQRKQKLLNRIREDSKAATIVYVTLQKTAQEIAEFLQQNQLYAQYYHAGLNSDLREQIQDQFMRGELHCVVATIAFGMGVDTSDVRRVIHYDLPKSIENYSQEIGRAGRDGQQSWCEVMADSGSMVVQENFIYGDTPELQSIERLLQQIKELGDDHWEIKLVTLANELNLRLLPMKTLLVYLELEGIIKPSYSYFQEYYFENTDTSLITDRFQGERKRFIESIFANSDVKQKYTYIDIQAVMNSYDTDRKRIVAALEYFHENQWLQLQTRQSVERFAITNSAFDVSLIAVKLHDVFLKKEKAEIQRLHNMLGFFQSNSCLSYKLADHFGEKISHTQCGHCSYCRNGPADFSILKPLKPLQSMDFKSMTTAYLAKAKRPHSVNAIAKFLCGINTPEFRTLKVKSMDHFSDLEQYPFADVREWVQQNLH